MLTKTDYLNYLLCPKAFWLAKHRPDLVTPPDAAQQRRMRQGQVVEEAARAHFPQGELIPWRPDPVEMVPLTDAAIAEGTSVIFQGTFAVNDLLVKTDILRRRENGWQLIEVKATTSVKPEHLSDLAFQYVVLQKAGFPVRSAAILHLNREYPEGSQQLFVLDERTAELAPSLRAAQEAIKAMRDVAACPAPPNVDIGKRCFSPTTCPFYHYCWQGITGLTVFHIPRLTEKRLRPLRQAGVLYLHEVPPDADLTPTQRAFVDFHTRQEVEINQEAICAELETLQYPLYFFDFETIDHALPVFEGCKPYQQVPFQYSCHILHADGRLEHREYLHTTPDDPRPGVVEALIHDIGEQGTLIAYNISFERGVLLHLAKQFPEHATRLHNMAERLWDQLLIFRKHYRDPRFQGSNSLKSVLPVLAPELSYKSLEVQNGAQAQVAWEAMLSEPDENAKQQRIAQLLAYCHLDTLAMVEIHRKLMALCKQEAPSA